MLIYSLIHPIRVLNIGFGMGLDDLKTHLVVFGATGSGKTGLLIVLMEELVRNKIPVLAIDVKGDLSNIALNPYDENVERVFGERLIEWRRKAEDNGIRREMFEGFESTVYTLGAKEGSPLNIMSLIGTSDPSDLELSASLVTSFSKSFSSSSVARGLVSAILREMKSFSFEELVRRIVEPTFSSIGALSIEEYMPKRKRVLLASEISSVVFSPAMEGFRVGEAFDPDRLRGATSIYLAHLPDDLKMLAVALILRRVYRWMLGKGSSESIRLGVFMDEVYGYLPPFPRNPPSKSPILLLLKQGRGFGVFMAIGTQNPRDIDYRAISNIGTWVIGRLRTEQDRNALVKGLSDALGVALGDSLAELDSREFMMLTPDGKVRRFKTRFAASYLKGPLTLEEIRELMKDRVRHDVTPPFEYSYVKTGVKGSIVYRPLLLFSGIADYGKHGRRGFKYFVDPCSRLVVLLERYGEISVEGFEEDKNPAEGEHAPLPEDLADLRRKAEGKAVEKLRITVYYSPYLKKFSEHRDELLRMLEAEYGREAERIRRAYERRLGAMMRKADSINEKIERLELALKSHELDALKEILSGIVRRRASHFSRAIGRYKSRGMVELKIRNLVLKREEVGRMIEELVRKRDGELERMKEILCIDEVNVAPRIVDSRVRLLWYPMPKTPL
jgi:DNA helicase HerA-like ATPase